MKTLILKTLCFIALSASAGELGPDVVEQLGPAGRKAYNDHRHLVNVVMKNYPNKTEVQVNAQYEKLTKVFFSTNDVVVDGEASIPVPPEVARHSQLFRSFSVEGEGLLGISRVDFVSDNDGFRETKMGQHSDKRFLLEAVLANFKEGATYKMVFKGKGTIKNIYLANWEGIATEFNPSPYIAPGLDKPIMNVDVKVDARKYRSIGGICELQRDRYFRYYASPNMDRAGKEPYFKGKGFLPGRQIEKLSFLLEDRYGAADRMPHLIEDAARPGYADPKFFKENKGFFWRFEGVDPDLTFAMCFDNWPSFMEPGVNGIANTTGTPKDYEAATDLAVQYLKAQVRDSGRTATWWEVKNECDIQMEWMWHGQKGYDSWKMLADFHNTMAEGIHAALPDVKVGGPASAYIQPHLGQFNIWKNHKRFMELTKGKVDFYSHHFYEVSSNNTYKEQWNGRNSYAQGIMECTLDLVKAQMTAMDYEVPILITEFGTLNAPRGDLGYWVHVKNVNNLMLNLLSRPQDVEMCVPFILTFMHWDPHATESFIHMYDDGEFYKTKNTYLLDLWDDYNGKRIASSSSHRKIFTHSLIDGDTLKIALNNRSDQRAVVSLSTKLPRGVKVVSATRKMPVYEKGEMKFIEEPVNDLSAVDIGVEVTQLIYVKLSKTPKLKAVQNETVWYAPDTAVKANGETEFTIIIPKRELAKKRRAATLRIGLHRLGGFEKGASAFVNGKKIATLDLSYSQGAQKFFDFFEMEFDPSLLEETNTIKILFDEADAFISSTKIRLITE
ncbi:glycoside hydrolase family 5 protein [Pontiella sulfatireligans]|nr:glycoside hydrolase family 5 protein [Pontiella sulfatireligans]